VSRSRIAFLIAAAALAVHELRWMVGGPVEPVAGHGYLPLVGILVALALALVSAHLLAVWGGIARAPLDGRPPRSLASWLALSGCIAGVFLSQELLEGALAAGRAEGLATVLGGGGWVALPLSLLAGALVMLGCAGARAVEPMRAHLPRPRLSVADRCGRRPSPWRGPLRRGLPRHLSARAPPSLA